MKKLFYILTMLPFLNFSQVQSVRICTLSAVQADFLTGRQYDKASFYLVQKTDNNVSFITEIEKKETDTTLFRNLSFIKNLTVRTYTFIPLIETPK